MKFEHCSSISFFRVAIHCTTGTSITITVQIIKANHFFFVFVFYMNSNHRIKSLFLFVFPNRHQVNTIHHFRKKKCDVKRKKLNQYKGGGQFGIVQKSAPNSRYLRSKFLWFLLSFFFLFFHFLLLAAVYWPFTAKDGKEAFFAWFEISIWLKASVVSGIEGNTNSKLIHFENDLRDTKKSPTHTHT